MHLSLIILDKRIKDKPSLFGTIFHNESIIFFSYLELILINMFREADRKMAGIQYSLEDRASLERKYKKQVNNCDNEASLIIMIETLAMMVITIVIIKIFRL